jgi:hypothetical protein
MTNDNLERRLARKQNAHIDEEPPKPPQRGWWSQWGAPVGAATAGFLVAQFTPHYTELDKLFAKPSKEVMGRMLATPVRLTETTYLANVVGVKLRDCPVKEGSFVGWAHDKNWRVTPFEFADAPGSNVRRPTGQQDFGFWQWVIRPTDTAVRITMIHACGDGEIHTEIGPFYIPRAIQIGKT